MKKQKVTLNEPHTHERQTYDAGQTLRLFPHQIELIRHKIRKPKTTEDSSNERE